MQESDASGCEKPRFFKHTNKFSLTINDADVANLLSQTFQETLGDNFNPNAETAHASGGLTDLATNVDKPCCF